MAQITQVNLQDLIKSRRIDSEFFKYQHIVSTIESMNSKELSTLSTWITQGPNPKFSKEGFDCLTGRNIADGSLSFLGTDKVDKVEFEHYKRFRLKADDLLITLKGAGSTGKVGVYRNEKPAMFSRNLGIIRAQKKVIHPYYIFAFLSSTPGQKLIDRMVTGGTGQLTLATSALKKLKVPIADNRKVEKIAQYVSQHFELQERSKRLYSQAQKLLLKELDLEDFKTEWVAGYETDRDSMLDAARMDAEYFQPKYNKIKEQILKADHAELEDLVFSIQKGVEVGSDAYQEAGVPFVRVSNMDVHEINDNNQQYISEDLFESLRDKHSPKEGEILLTKDGTPGIAHYVSSRSQTFTTISGGILRLEPKEIEPEYFTLALNSPVVQSQIAQDAGGALIKHWRPDQVKKTIIPVLSEDKRQEIVDLVRQSSNALSESKRLLEQAKKEVEDMIEKQANV